LEIIRLTEVGLLEEYAVSELIDACGAVLLDIGGLLRLFLVLEVEVIEALHLLGGQLVELLDFFGPLLNL
jgi:hypothetical protein